MATLVVTTPYAKGGGSIVRANFNDNLKLVPFTFVPSASYTTSGDTIPTGSGPAGYKDLLNGGFSVFSSGPYAFQYDAANSKLLCWGTTTGGVAAQTTAGTNLTTALGSSAVTIFFAVR